MGKPWAEGISRRPRDLFTPTKAMAGNQGLYNGFLAAGLIWAVVIGDADWARNIALFFASCVAIAWLYGAATAARTAFYVQTVPAAAAILALLLS